MDTDYELLVDRIVGLVAKNCDLRKVTEHNVYEVLEEVFIEREELLGVLEEKDKEIEELEDQIEMVREEDSFI